MYEPYLYIQYTLRNRLWKICQPLGWAKGTEDEFSESWWDQPISEGWVRAVGLGFWEIGCWNIFKSITPNSLECALAVWKNNEDSLCKKKAGVFVFQKNEYGFSHSLAKTSRQPSISDICVYWKVVWSCNSWIESFMYFSFSVFFFSLIF